MTLLNSFATHAPWPKGYRSASGGLYMERCARINHCSACREWLTEHRTDNAAPLPRARVLPSGRID